MYGIHRIGWRGISLLVGGIVLLLLALGIAETDTAAAQDNTARCFDETGYCIKGPIRAYWEQNGGLSVFGYPIAERQTEMVEDRELPVQWFERDRLEIQPDGTVTAGRLGARLLDLRGPPWRDFAQVESTPPGCTFFPETNHSLCEPFLSYWEQNGGLERFGYPISEPREETIEEWTGTVQWFERCRMEHHTELPGQPILLGLLGREVRDLREGGAMPTPASTPVIPTQDQPAGGLTLAAVEAGHWHTCVLRSDDSIVCWGNNRDGESQAPAGTFTQVSAGSEYTCGLHSDGSITCWGSNAYEQADTPAGIFTQVSAGYNHTCGVRTSGSIACWGRNEYGQASPPLGSFSQVHVAYNHTCGLRTDGSIACWGNNDYWFNHAHLMSSDAGQLCILPASVSSKRYSSNQRG